MSIRERVGVATACEEEDSAEWAGDEETPGGSESVDERPADELDRERTALRRDAFTAGATCRGSVCSRATTLPTCDQRCSSAEASVGEDEKH